MRQQNKRVSSQNNAEERTNRHRSNINTISDRNTHRCSYPVDILLEIANNSLLVFLSFLFEHILTISTIQLYTKHSDIIFISHYLIDHKRCILGN